MNWSIGSNVWFWPRLCENAAVVPVVRKATSQIASGSTIEVQGMVGLPTKTRPSHVFTQPRPCAAARGWLTAIADSRLRVGCSVGGNS